MKKHLSAIFVICLLMAACGSSKSGRISSNGPADPNQNPYCSVLPPANILTMAICGYNAIDSNQAETVCRGSDPNSILSVACYAPDPNACVGCRMTPKSGTWKTVGPSVAHVSGQFNCQGATSPALTGWMCAQQSITVTFADGSKKDYTANASYDANHQIRPLELGDCNPVLLDTTLVASDGSSATLTLYVPGDAFAPGTVRVQPSDSNMANVTLVLTSGTWGGAYTGGTTSTGTVTFLSTTFLPSDLLAFDLDVDVSAPAQNLEQGTQTLYCGQSGDRYAGQWLVFVPNP